MATASLSIEANTGHGTREYVAATLDALDCRSTDIVINPDIVEDNGTHRDPTCRISCGCCGRSLDDVAMDPAAPHYRASASRAPVSV